MRRKAEGGDYKGIRGKEKEEQEMRKRRSKEKAGVGAEEG